MSAERIRKFEPIELQGTSIGHRIQIGAMRILHENPHAQITAWVNPYMWESALRAWLTEGREVNLIHEKDGTCTMMTGLQGYSVRIRVDRSPEDGLALFSINDA